MSWLFTMARQKTTCVVLICVLCPCAGCSTFTDVQRNSVKETLQTQSAFASADSDHDGQLTWSEFRLFMEKILLKYNANAWRTLSAREQEAVLFSWFLTRDHGAKGFLTLTDWLE